MNLILELLWKTIQSHVQVLEMLVDLPRRLREPYHANN